MFPEVVRMPEKKTIERARKDAREGKARGTQAGEYVREEMEHIRKGKHGAASTKQAIAIGLAKARRAGVKLAPPKAGRASEATRKKARQDIKRAHSHKSVSKRQSAAREAALKREPRSAASHAALSRQAKSAARARRRRGETSTRRKHR
ncbi:MAG TPA: hypothetical protein VMG40_02165 [Bryobacteraceae bacterium]|nr:hypothetical protein [Bryobacteraceae bacterium]